MKIVIGIDPDVNKSGVAEVVNGEVRMVDKMIFPDLYKYLHRQIIEIHPYDKLVIVVEAGWLNASNWHLGRIPSLHRAAKIGESVGRCFQVGIDILSLIRSEADGFENIRIIEQKPLRKIWRGKDGKITSEELEAVVGKKIKTNQEGRDACLLAWSHR